jgi:predicted dehydrogenase
VWLVYAAVETGCRLQDDNSHEIDYAIALFGVPTDIKASYGKFSNFDINTEDVAEIQLLYERGNWESSFIVTLHLDYLQKEIVRRMKIYSVKKHDHTCIEWTYGRGVLVKQYFDPDNPTFNKGIGPFWQKPYSFDPNNMYIREMRHFIKCCEDKLQGEQVWPGASLADGIGVMNIIARVMGNARCRK